MTLSLSALLSRSIVQARDVFDLNELLTNNIKIDINLIQKKLESYKIKFELKEFTKKIKEKEKIYNNEMKNLVEIYPDFNECKKRIIKEFNLILF